MLAALAFGLALCATASAAPLEAYGRLPNMEALSISPSGHALAMIVTNGERRVVAVQDLGQKKLVFRGDAGDTKVRQVMWAGDKHLVIVASTTAAPMDILHSRREWLLGFVVDIESGKSQMLLRNVADVSAMNALADMPQVRLVDGKPVIFVEGIVFQDGKGNVALFRNHLGAPTTRLLQKGENGTVDWVIGPEGEPLGQEIYDTHRGRWSLKLRTAGGWREVMTAQGLDTPYVLGLGRDGRSVMVAVSDDEERASWQEVTLEGPAGSPILAQDDQSPIYDPRDGRLVGHRSLVGDEHAYTFFDEGDAKVWKAIRAAFPEDSVELVSWSDDRRKIIVHLDSATHGSAFSLVDLDTGRASWLGDEYNDLKPEDIAAKRPLRFKAADGLELTGYLTLPRGRPEKNLPLVVFPHGGPASRDTPGFDWWAQGMASRGYAVLQVNFRGSEGLGGELLEAGYGEWGRKMQTDLSDGVRWLASQGVIDPRRVCIVGASYGGYAALAGATIDRGVYRCAVSVAGVSDLKRHVAYSRTRGGRTSERYWTRFIGAEDLGDPVMRIYSPALLADQADIPVLLIHGKDDTVVPLEQSRIMDEALRKAGKPVELIVQKGADHWLSRGDTRLETLQATITFLERHNPPN
ncbi:alpha/beta hydrolase family protein [Phenylobacterium zucineum]|nr:S9 family peptidase [Phenylobacterium zucineum]